MKILISADIEGIAGVVHAEQTRPGNTEYESARRLMTEEVNAAIRGAFAGGASEVTVNDSHGTFRNLIPELLHPEARTILGKPRAFGMMAGLATDIGGVMLVGYHGRSQSRGILTHTINSFAFARIWFNDIEVGEAGIYGALAGEFRVPVLFGSGDDVFGNEFRELFPQAEYATVKQAMGNSSGVSLSPQKARAALESGARSAVENAGRQKALMFSCPIRCRVQSSSPILTDLFCQLPGTQRLDGVLFEFTMPSVEHAVRVLNCLSVMSVALKT